MGTNERYDEVGIPRIRWKALGVMRTQQPSGVSFRRRTDVGTSSRSGGERTPRRAPSGSSTPSSTSSRGTHPRDLDVARWATSRTTTVNANTEMKVMRWDGVVVTPYLGPVGLALYEPADRKGLNLAPHPPPSSTPRSVVCKEPGQRVHQRAQAATKSALKPLAQRSVHPRSALNRPPSARTAFSSSTISPPTPIAARTVAIARMPSSSTSRP